MFVKVKVFPSSKEEKIISKGKDEFEVYVREKPEKGMANKRVRELLGNYFHLPLSKIILRKGAQKRNKIFEIKNE